MPAELNTPFPAASPIRWDPRAASLLLVAAMCCVPFLLPRHFPPLRTFYDEWIAFTLGTSAIAFAAFGRRTQGTRVSTPALWLFAFSLLLLFYSASSMVAYPQGSMLWALYVLYAALLVILGYDLASHFGRDRVCTTICTLLLLGATLNAIVGVLQFVGIPPQIDDFVSYLNGSRAIGNIGQANLYTNYLSLGLASVAYLNAKGKISAAASIGAGCLLVIGISLAGSRASIVYSAIFVLLGVIAVRLGKSMPDKRLGYTAIAIGASSVLVQWLLPASLNFYGATIQGTFYRPSGPDWASTQDESVGLRLQAWQLAIQIFGASPWMGVGPGEFAGAGFALGLPPALATGEIWTSPHNMVLQLLAETGLLGAVLVCLALWTWFRQAAIEFCSRPTPAGWWLTSCASVEITHALLEYPLWYAHFLGITALILGVGSTSTIRMPPLALKAVLACSAIAGAILLGITLRDYLRFDLASPIHAGRSLAPDAEFQSGLDTIAGLRGGLLAPRAELWLFLSVPTTPQALDEKLEIGARVLRTWPTFDVILKQCIFLALAGRDAEAQALLSRALTTFPKRKSTALQTVESAPDPARRVLEPILLP